MFSEALDGIVRIWQDFSHWTPPDMVMFAILLFSAVSAFLVTKFTSAPKMVSVPVSFMLLVFSGMVANFMGKGYYLEATTEFQKALMFTVAGHCVVAVLLLSLFKVGEVRR